jgi:hypothetical protein
VRTWLLSPGGSNEQPDEQSNHDDPEQHLEEHGPGCAVTYMYMVRAYLMLALVPICVPCRPGPKPWRLGAAVPGRASVSAAWPPSDAVVRLAQIVATKPGENVADVEGEANG